MADVLAGFVSGMKAGQSANSARAKAAAIAAEKKANYDLKLATQANVVRGAEEKDLDRIRAMVTSDKWDSSQLPMALEAAMSHDQRHGVSNGMSYLNTALNLKPTQNRDSHGNRKYETGKDGTVSTGVTRSPNAGFTGERQRLASGDKLQNLQTEAVANKIMPGGMQYLSERTEPGIPMSPADSVKYINEYHAKVLSGGDLDPTIVAVEIKKLLEATAQRNEAMANMEGESREMQEAVDKVTVLNEKWIDGMLGIDAGLVGNLTVLTAGLKPIKDQLSEFMNVLAKNNIGHAQAKIYVYEAFKDELGDMPLLKDDELYSGMLAGTPRGFSQAAKMEYETNGGRFNDYAKPFYDKETGQGFMFANPKAGPIPEGGVELENGLVAFPMTGWTPPQEQGPQMDLIESGHGRKPAPEVQGPPAPGGLTVEGIKEKAGEAAKEKTKEKSLLPSGAFSAPGTRAAKIGSAIQGARFRDDTKMRYDKEQNVFYRAQTEDSANKGPVGLSPTPKAEPLGPTKPFTPVQELANTARTASPVHAKIATDYGEHINTSAASHGVDPALIVAMIRQESGGKITARSGKGAQGLMQLMPATAKEMGVTDSNDPAQNIEGGTKYIAKLIKRYHGDINLALAAYNAGMGNVRKAGNKVPDFKETKDYVRKIMAEYRKMSKEKV